MPSYAPVKPSDFANMRLDILTLFPNMMSMFFEESILSRAQKKGIVEVVFHDLHDYSLSRYGSESSIRHPTARCSPSLWQTRCR